VCLTMPPRRSDTSALSTATPVAPACSSATERGVGVGGCVSPCHPGAVTPVRCPQPRPLRPRARAPLRGVWVWVGVSHHATQAQ
jgi:hypothetical protein